MSAARILFYVQHLLGVGHLMRAARLARGLAEAGFAVELVSGGPPVPGLDLGRARLFQLPPLRSRDESFAVLVDAEGRAVDAAWLAARRERLLAFFQAQPPDVLMLEMFPFGRRQMRFELLPLIELALAARPRPLLVASVRDIVQARRKPGRNEETAALVERAFDLVLVHGDPALVHFESSFPLADRLGGRLRYTGYVAAPPPKRGRPGDPGWDEVVVSGGGSAVGAVLLATALAARPLTRLATAPWRLLAGGGVPDADFRGLAAQAPMGVIVERARPDFPQILANCHVSVSQAGYNTAMDVLNAGVPAVLVPFVGQGETEQSLRAERLAERGLVQLVAARDLTPHRLAAAVDAASLMRHPSGLQLDRGGIARSAAILAARLAEHRSRGGALP
ncbi:MAG TPA: glycosyltransferase [Alphaproteobacteria bacterium]|nr:glycosyltransferase [Alphaproteobacteria bacterium]